jgi:hypothetical protein
VSISHYGTGEDALFDLMRGRAEVTVDKAKRRAVQVEGDACTNTKVQVSDCVKTHVTKRHTDCAAAVRRR